MNSVTNKTRLAEKRYRDNVKNDRKEVKLQKTKNTTKLQKKKKQYELNKRRNLIRKQIEPNKEINQNDRKEKRENMVEDFDLGRFFELATSNKLYVNSLNLHEIKNGILQHYTGDFELNGSLNIEPFEHKTKIRYKNMDDFEYKCDRY